MTLVTHTYPSGENGFATFSSAANGTKTTVITAGVLSFDVLPGPTYARVVLQTFTSDTVLVVIPATGPIDLAFLIPQTPTPATVGVLTSSSIGTVVAGFSAIGQVLDRSGNGLATAAQLAALVGRVAFLEALLAGGVPPTATPGAYTATYSTTY